jgi:epoxyqueuosine reductase
MLAAPVTVQGTLETLSARVRQLGRAAGFDHVGIATAAPFEVERSRYLEWLDGGRQGDMQWMNPERAERSSDPGCALPGATSIISVGMSYWHGRRPPRPANGGLVARYAWGRDYHVVLGDRLAALVSSLETEFDGSHRWYVDTGPMMDKAVAARAGVGWYGKNTNILTPSGGSWVLLGEILTTLELAPDVPIKRTCGSCSLCTIACPTGALGPDYSIDSRKCISYLTIEHRGKIPVELRTRMGAWVFGCDVCQDVCPPSAEPHLRSREERVQWAREVRRSLQGREETTEVQASNVSLASGPLHGDGVRPYVDLFWLLTLSHAGYLEAFRGSSIRRAKVWMLRRNAAVALGNVGGEDALGPLLTSVSGDEHPVVRGHAAWAVLRLSERGKCAAPRDALKQAYAVEQDADVRNEILAALSFS